MKIRKINEQFDVDYNWDDIFEEYQYFIDSFPFRSNERQNKRNSFKNWLKRNYQIPEKIIN